MHCLFEDAGQYRAGRILTKAEASLQIELGSGRRVKVKQAQCLLEFATPEAEAFLSQAQSQAAELDPDFLWQCAPDDDFGFAQFSQEVYGSQASALDQASLAFALHGAPMYFYRRGKGVFRRAPPEALQAALAGAERKRLAAEAQAQLTEAIVAGTDPLPQEIASQALGLLIRPDKQSIAYKALESAAHTLQTTPSRLLLSRGALPSAYTLHRARFLTEGLAHPHAEGPASLDLAALAHRKAALLQSLPQAQAVAYSIDDADTFEVDDAFSLVPLYAPTPDQEGTAAEPVFSGWRVGIHIAAPGLLIEPESALGQWARDRASTVYFPGEKITMLPPEAIALASLDAGARVPAVSLYLEFSPQGERLRQTSCVETVEIAQNIRHGDWEEGFETLTQTLETVQPEALDTPARPQCADLPWTGLLPLLFLARGLRRARETARGKPEPTGRTDFQLSVRWHDDPRAHQLGLGTPEISLRRRGSALDILVSEFMIATNVAWGEALALAQLPGIYRCQTFGRVRMQTSPGPHQGLGVSHYAWSTSPLRRYSDLINQWQLLAVLGQRRAVFRQADASLYADLAHFDACYDRYAEFQTQMERYWSIRWLGAQAGMPTESWSRSPDQPPIIEPAVAGREGLFRLRRAPAIVRLPDWSQLAPGTEVQVELLSGDALDIHLEARGQGILKESRVDHYAVLGSPIAHSRSPFIHHAFAGQSEAALQYDRIETSAEALAQTLDRLWAEGYKGLNLTIPLKEAAFALAQTRGWNIAPRAQAAGAVNTLVRVAETNQTGEAAEGGSWSADNTDGIGLVRDLTRILGDGGLNGNEVLIIGAGGATRGLISPFRDAGLQRIVLANRSVEKAIALAEQMNHSLSAPLIPLGLDALQAETLPDGSPWPSLVINATAASLEGASLAVHPRIFTSAQLVLDLMYGPKAEVFLGQARAAGAPLCADGLGMLVEQAAESFFLWTGQRPDTEPVREALVAALESDA
ncbi:MAG: shikimate dehydrogenase [Betaproteobacteria bacterium]|nr:shikimate dehydrogenase [Betaproteobacteria bacterium]